MKADQHGKYIGDVQGFLVLGAVVEASRDGVKPRCLAFCTLCGSISVQRVDTGRSSLSCCRGTHSQSQSEYCKRVGYRPVMTEEQLAKRSKPVIICGVTYKSIREAARKLNIDKAAIQYRVKHGLSLDVPFEIRKKPNATG